MSEKLKPSPHNVKSFTQEFHDTVCQSLTALSVTLDVYHRRAARGETISATDLQNLRDLLDRAQQDAAHLADRLEKEGTQTT